MLLDSLIIILFVGVSEGRRNLKIIMLHIRGVLLIQATVGLIVIFHYRLIDSLLVHQRIRFG